MSIQTKKINHSFKACVTELMLNLTRLHLTESNYQNVDFSTDMGSFVNGRLQSTQKRAK